MPRKAPPLACPVPTVGCGLSHHDIPPSPPITQLPNIKSAWCEQSSEETLLSSSNDENMSFENENEPESNDVGSLEEGEDEEEEEEENDFNLFSRQESMLIDEELDDDEVRSDIFLDSLLLDNWKFTAPELPTQGTPRTPRNPSEYPFNVNHSEARYHFTLSQAWENHCQQMKEESETIPLENGIVTVKLLVSEARRLSLLHARHRIESRRGVKNSCHCTDCPIPEHISDEEYLATLRQVWIQIHQTAVAEVLSDGQHFNTIRRLSNMYLFLEGNQLMTFEIDNPWLMTRMRHQQTVLQTIGVWFIL